MQLQDTIAPTMLLLSPQTAYFMIGPNTCSDANAVGTVHALVLRIGENRHVDVEFTHGTEF